MMMPISFSTCSPSPININLNSDIMICPRRSYLMKSMNSEHTDSKYKSFYCHFYCHYIMIWASIRMMVGWPRWLLKSKINLHVEYTYIGQPLAFPKKHARDKPSPNPKQRKQTASHSKQRVEMDGKRVCGWHSRELWGYNASACADKTVKHSSQEPYLITVWGNKKYCIRLLQSKNGKFIIDQC